MTNRITSKLIDKIQTEVTIEGAVKAYKLYTGILGSKEKKEFNLRLWMDEEVPPVEDAMNARNQGKVSVVASYFNDKRGMLKEVGELTMSEHWGYSFKITKVVLEDQMNPKETELSWDVSSEQNGSVMSYLVRNEGSEELYTLYIQSDGGIKANPNSSYLFYSFPLLTTIEGIENLDTSQVTNMVSMFSNCGELTNLDLSHFDTSNVTNMSQMFFWCSGLTRLDVSNFNTSNVTNMSGMFSKCSSLISIDLSYFDTSKVTNMSNMFSHCNSLLSLDISSFITSNVTDIILCFGAVVV